MGDKAGGGRSASPVGFPLFAGDASERRSWLVLTCVGTGVLYLGALIAPAISADDGDLFSKDGSPIGLIVLLFGWLGGCNFIPWSANVFLLFGLGALLGDQYRIQRPETKPRPPGRPPVIPGELAPLLNGCHLLLGLVSARCETMAWRAARR